MAPFELECTAAIASSPALTSSFLPKCTHFSRAKLAHWPTPRTSSFNGVVASTKQKKKGRKSSSPAREWSYEHLMVLWDEVFEHCCTDTVKATRIRDLACKGLRKHGRGCVLVFQEVQTRPRGPGTGFTSKPPKTSRRVPDFVTLDYQSVYLPREFLLDPRKAPLEEDIAGHDDKDQPQDNASRIVVETENDVSIDVKNMAETPYSGSEMGSVTDSGGKVIDIDEIIRSAQDVYQFYTDDEDELDDDTDNDDDDDDNVLSLDDKESGANAIDSSLILNGDSNEGNGVAMDASDDNNILIGVDDKEGDSILNMNDRHSMSTLDGDHGTIPMNASESLNKQESSILILDDDDDDDGGVATYVNTPLLKETEDKEDFNVTSDRSAHAHYGCDDVMYGTQTSTAQSNIGDFNVGIEHNSISRTGWPTSSGDGASAAQNAPCQDGANSHATELLKESNEITGVQDERNGGTHTVGSVGNSIETSVATAHESFDPNTLESNALVRNEKGNENPANQEGEDDDVEVATQQMLYASMRGMDRTRLMSLTANFDFEAERFRFGRRMAVIDVRTTDAGGENPYNPEEDELVLLLHLLVDGRPAYGADVLVAHRDEEQTVAAGKDYWKLKGKYRHVFT